MIRPAPDIVAADAAGLHRAVALVRTGQLVALPTETVYGLAGDASNAEAVAAIYAAKGRPDYNPLIVHVADRAMAEDYVVFPPAARALADRFWPGPLTLVLPRKTHSPIAAAVHGGRDTLAVRCPAHAVMRHVIAQLGRPLAAPSANASGHISPTTAQHVLKSLGDRLALIVDDGACAAGVESTIVGFEQGLPVILRHGALSAERLGIHAANTSARTRTDISAPGQLASHYAPRQPVRLNAETAQADEYHIGFGKIAGDDNLSPSGNVEEAAAALFAALHRAEDSGAARIAVAPIPHEGVGQAINDRLRRAAAPRA